MTAERSERPTARSRGAARLVFWALAGAITVLALYPRLTLPEPGATEGVTHSYNHILAFTSLMLIGSLGWGLRRHLVAGVIVGAIVLELAQTLSPGRQTTLGDMAASLGGVVLGYAIARLIGMATALRADRRGAAQSGTMTRTTPAPPMRRPRPEPRP